MSDTPSLSVDDVHVSVRRLAPRRALVDVRVGEGDGPVVSMQGYQACQLAARLVSAATDAVPPRSPDALTVDEFRLMMQLIHRYSETELDQWATYSLSTGFGHVFISLLMWVDNPDFYTNLDGFLADPNATEWPDGTPPQE